ncbi:hypothetical protein [Actinopolymorpha rutila]|uniref:Tc toxin complex TcA C-terminal TcB-binding domain-containing protein n=1 Tax=Actinopolymorpha rutila TaxID=446787 RepID=A0A852ZSM6_9ACTN|nr:hypothetical protein [Actinopolymorpha rutila]NYH92000.1 hypothetical protein [Actinopolymorpha rutila]
MSVQDPGQASRREFVQAGLLGSEVLPSADRDNLVAPDAAPAHELPKSTEVETVLARVEDLIGRGHLGTALRAAAELPPGGKLSAHYEFLRHEKLARAHVGIADRYFLRGDAANARIFYERAVSPETTDPTVRATAQLAGQVFDELGARRTALVDRLTAAISKDDYGNWCADHSDLTRLTLLDVAALRQRISPDFRLEPTLGERPPIDPDPGYVDPLPAESELVDFGSAVPATVFSATSTGAVAVDVSPQATDGRLRASVAMPLIAGVFTAKARLLALDARLTPTGQSPASVPLFRYEHLRDQAERIADRVRQIESRMLPIQFELDDFAQVVDAVRRPLAEQEAELLAVNQRIADLTQGLTALAQAEKAVDQVVVALDAVEDQCDCDWWCWLTASLCFLFAAAIVVATSIVAAPLTPLELGFFLTLAIPLDVFVGDSLVLAGLNTINCDNVGEITTEYKTTLNAIRQGITQTRAELSHALTTRDALVASISALSDQLCAVYASNAARLLDAKTLDAIQSQYNAIRQSLLTRAQSVAKLAEDAFNFERDADVHVVKDAYYDDARKGYTSAESLLHDLGGFDHIELTGRTQKAMQLSHTVSLARHYPMSLVALRATGRTRFTTKLAEFDRWFPGTYQQRIKEVGIEVFVDGEPVPARGYLSNDGVSWVRFVDSGNKRLVDGVQVFAEPDPDLVRLCYKRFQRQRHVDTMAFPPFSSYLHQERMRQLQARERNFFENVGLESSWAIELLPDQPFDLSLVTDVRVSFQYEAMFDENLKRVLEKKRYTGRKETAALSARKLGEARGTPPDLTGTFGWKVGPDLFEASVLERTVVNVGFLVSAKGLAALPGKARLEISYEGAAPVQVETNDVGVVATASGTPAGSGLAALEAMAHGKPVTGSWTGRVVDLPAGVHAGDVDDVLLLLNYEYAT